MRVELSKDFTFEAAHKLPNLPSTHKCSRLHGHSFKVKITVEGEVDPQVGWFIDYGDINIAFKPLLDEYLDHHYLNEIQGLGNPTSENIAKWIWDRIRNQLLGLKSVDLSETCTNGCRYKGE